MRIALCSTIVPFVEGGARNIVRWLGEQLVAAGHEVAVVEIPEVDHPNSLFDQMVAIRSLRLDDADRVITFRPQSHLIQHPCKVIWFIHHLRTYYDLWNDLELGPPHTVRNEGFRDALHRVDTDALLEAHAVFTNSSVVRDRLAQFNGVDAEILYPPILHPERYFCAGHDDTIVYVSRMEPHKRQHLLLEALPHTTSPVRVRLCGVCRSGDYLKRLRRLASAPGVTGRAIIDDRWISEDEKAAILNGCLAAAYLPNDEDSYGYPTLEAAHACKPTVTTTDAGGVLEFVEDRVTGRVASPNPREIARVLDDIGEHRDRTIALGEAARRRIDELGISWTRVLERLLA